jgi:predicted Rdx family selenoprotein
MATEFYSVGGGDVAITVTPGDAGVLQVIVDGDTIYDKVKEDNQTPHLNRVKELKAIVQARLDG